MLLTLFTITQWCNTIQEINKTNNDSKVGFRAPDPTQLNSTQLNWQLSWVESIIRVVEQVRCSECSYDWNNWNWQKIAPFLSVVEFWIFSEFLQLSWVGSGTLNMHRIPFLDMLLQKVQIVHQQLRMRSFCSTADTTWQWFDEPRTLGAQRCHLLFTA